MTKTQLIEALQMRMRARTADLEGAVLDIMAAETAEQEAAALDNAETMLFGSDEDEAVPSFVLG